MTNDERICAIALTLCEGIGHINAKRLIDEMGSATAVFENRLHLREIIPDVNQRLIDVLDCPEAFKRAEKELTFAENNHITCLTIKDEAYPSRLRECEDAPTILFFKGHANLNRLHIISMVGTRMATPYGKDFCETFVRDLAFLCPDVMIISGMAYGIDIHSHRAALANHLPTIGVLAHGLDRIYPHKHRKTAIDMLSNGGLLTEYLTGTEPDAYNFVSRNRIVAGMADATIVVESAPKGGSLITASLANTYNKDCFAVPGRINDELSKGCNQLIKENKAALITNAEDFVKAMNWKTSSAKPEAIQRNLFVDLTPDEELVVNLLKQRGDMHINTLTVDANMPIHKLTTLLFGLEMKGVLKALVGGVYHLLT
ncbi:MAG: DNA-processing protein DprA [Bacteroidaceae bacterium]|nr:DNA-processing protein DprA [Bacteroidaceae bacterium]